jgi:hypothetical protein
MSRRAIAQLSVLSVSLASACSSSPPRGTPTQQVRSGNQIGDGSGSPATETDVDNAMRKRGYKPAIYRGERVYCKNVALTGSNLESSVCLTAKQIEEQERSGKDILNGNRQVGCSPKLPCN